jgi:hypothetical protein
MAGTAFVDVHLDTRILSNEGTSYTSVVKVDVGK